MSNKDQQIIIIMAENKPGVLSKVTSLCRRRRYNIKSLTAGRTHLPNISNMTLVFSKEKERIQNIANQINKIVEVVSVEIVQSKDVIDRELVLLTVKNSAVANKLLKNSVHDINIRIINTVGKYFVLEIVGEGGEIEHLLNKLDFKKDVVQLMRSGLVALKL